MTTRPWPPGHPHRSRLEDLSRMFRDAEREVLARHADEVEEAFHTRLVAYARELLTRAARR